MELVDGFKSVHIDCWFPAHFIVAYPLDEVLKLPSEHPGVFNLLDFVFLFSFHNDWWWWFMLLPWNRIDSGLFQAGYWLDIVNA